MKKKFSNENEKFEYNVVKLNLLNIIDKLKMQVDKEKKKNKKEKELVASWFPKHLFLYVLHYLGIELSTLIMMTREF